MRASRSSDRSPAASREASCEPIAANRVFEAPRFRRPALRPERVCSRPPCAAVRNAPSHRRSSPCRRRPSDVLPRSRSDPAPETDSRGPQRPSPPAAPRSLPALFARPRLRSRTLRRVVRNGRRPRVSESEPRARSASQSGGAPNRGARAAAIQPARTPRIAARSPSPARRTTACPPDPLSTTPSEAPAGAAAFRRSWPYRIKSRKPELKTCTRPVRTVTDWFRKKNAPGPVTTGTVGSTCTARSATSAPSAHDLIMDSPKEPFWP